MTNKVAIITGGNRASGATPPSIWRGVDILFTWRAQQPEAESLIREIEALDRGSGGIGLDTRDIRTFDGFVAEGRKALQRWRRAVRLFGQV